MWVETITPLSYFPETPPKILHLARHSYFSLSTLSPSPGQASLTLPQPHPPPTQHGPSAFPSLLVLEDSQLSFELLILGD